MNGQQDEDWESKAPHTVSEDQVHGHPVNLNVHKSVGPDEMYPRVLKELADAVAKLLSMIFKKSWQSGKVPGDWKKGNSVPVFKNRTKNNPGNHQPVSLSSACAWEGHGTDPPRRHMKDRAVLHQNSRSTASPRASPA